MELNKVIRLVFLTAGGIAIVVTPIAIWFCSTFEPMILADTRLVVPDETWLAKHAQLGNWFKCDAIHPCPPEVEGPYVREGTIETRYNSISFAHQSTEPNGGGVLRLAKTSTATHRRQVATDVCGMIGLEAFSLWIVYRLILRRTRREREMQ